MSTGIEWTDETWNPTTGCTKVSEGCDNCYAERIANRFGGPGYFDTVRLHPDRLDKPLHWRKPRMVFVDSMSDLFHGDVPDEFIAQVFTVMAMAPEHTFQVLTKRPGRMASLLKPRIGGPLDGLPVTFSDFSDLVGRSAMHHCKETGLRPDWPDAPDGSGRSYLQWPLPNVWLGVSVENQKRAEVRIPKLLETPAAVRFLSCEPVLGPVDFSAWLGRMEYERDDGQAAIYRPALGWVIVGGESGPGARPMHPTWVRTIRDECQAAGVPFFFKQWGEFYGTGNRVGKKAAGRRLDGRTWGEMPPLLTKEET